MLRLLRYLTAFGEINPLCDDVLYADLIRKALDGSYRWTALFRDTLSPNTPDLSGHSSFFPVFFQMALAFLSAKYFYVLPIYLGFCLSLLKGWLTYDAFTRGSRRPERFLLLPILAFLYFSPSQVSTFEFGTASLEQSLFQLGFIFGVWGLVRFPQAWTGIEIMIAGGLLASWSWGGGPLTWPVYAVGMAAIGFRKAKFYLAWAAGAAVAALPYLYSLSSQHFFTAAGDSGLHRGGPDVAMILQSIGWPMVQAFSPRAALLRGALGLTLFLGATLAVAARKDRGLIRKALPGFLVSLFSLLNILQISLFRDALMPWYAAPFMLFWIGLAGIFFAWWEVADANFLARAPILLAASLLIYVYGSSNLSFADKSLYLKLRSPTAVSCLRHYRTAPTYCQVMVMMGSWPPPYSLASLAESLDRSKLSVFAPRQTWSLQGDYILDTVRPIQAKDAPPLFWTANPGTDAKLPSTDFHHLNLFLHGGNAVEWTVTLPENLESAVFRSALAISPSAPHDPQADGVDFQLSVQTESGPPRLLLFRHLDPEQRDWQELQVSLAEFRGQTVTLRLSSQMSENPTYDWALLRYPHINLELGPAASETDEAAPEIRPTNTDRSPAMAQPTSADYAFDLSDARQWTVRNMTAVTGPEVPPHTWRVGGDPQLEFSPSLSLPLENYTHLYFKLSASPGILARDLEVFFKLNGQADFSNERSITIPLLADGGQHAYSYDLKLLDIEPGNRLTGLRVDPVLKDGPEGDNLVRMTDLRLIASPGIAKN